MNISTTIQKSALPDIEKWKKIFADRLKKCRTVKDKNGNTVKTRSGKEKMYSVESVVDHTQGYVSPTNYRHWENCDLSAHLPHGECLADIANTYHVSVDYLLGLSDFRTPENGFIGKEIGLTDGTIEKLRKWNQVADGKLCSLLSEIIENPQFDEMMIEYITSLMGYSDGTNPDNHGSNGLKSRVTFMYMIQQTFTQIIKEMSDKRMSAE